MEHQLDADVRCPVNQDLFQINPREILHLRLYRILAGGPAEKYSIWVSEAIVMMVSKNQ